MKPSTTSTRVALLGLGLMGTGMARRLLGAGFPLTVYNRNPARATPLAEAGAQIAASPRDAATAAEVIISMVADDVASRNLWLGESGALAGAAPGAVCIECSTVTVRWVLELAAAAGGRGCEFIDAPVTGSRLQAAAGELNLLVGGTPANLERIRPVLLPLSRSITLLGPVGSGALVKLVNNFVCGVQVAALAEAMVWIERAGLEKSQALEVLTLGAPGSPIVKTVAARMAAADYTPNFYLSLMAKDIGYAIKEAGAKALELTTASVALAAFQRAIAAGHGMQDMAAIIEPLRGKG